MSIKTTTYCDAHPVGESVAELTLDLSVGADCFEADLCEACLGGLEQALAPFIAAARAPRCRSRPAKSRRASARMRAWWREHQDLFPDHPWQPRGRIPAFVAARYHGGKRAAA